MTEIKNISELLGKSLPDIKELQGSQKESFEKALKDAIKEAAEVEQEAQKAIEAFSKGELSIHQVVLAMEKADMTLQTLIQVRNKVLTAYEEISRMQV
ncbi:MAG: flagellar hook-basal body complex protein FliE [Thermodesulfovibrio sp.]|nr:flagellar hook-basal body complex protein FliE [Thermodesulfovibrio sp.]MDW7998748.1 flagellar hook-basal body complex protein FliE [Thermodesulfovibrio sp.]